jgi:transposase
VARLLREMGHEVLVVNSRRVRLIAESTLKTDRVDAEVLAQLSCFGRGLLRGVYQRREEASLLQTRLGVRSVLVRSGHLTPPGEQALTQQVQDFDLVRRRRNR